MNIKNLWAITTSRMVSIAKLYAYDGVTTSNVKRLHKALKWVINECDRVEVKVTVEVEEDEIIDIFNSLNDAIEVYKSKNNLKTIPSDLNIYQLIDDLTRLNPKEIIQEILKDKPTRVDKKDNINHRESILNKMMLDALK